MPGSDGERIARNDQRIADLERRLGQLSSEWDEMESKWRKTEWAVKLIVEAQRTERTKNDQRQRRIEVRINVLIAAAALSAVLLSIVQAVIR